LSLGSEIDSISEFIRTYRPSLFVHCAGAMSMDNFHSYDKTEKYISKFITSTVKLAQVFIQNKQNNKYGIVLMSLCVSYFSTPFNSLYASKKSFVIQFVRSLNVEYPNIHFLCLHRCADNNV
jgi:short-subunit dehydrogenase